MGNSLQTRTAPASPAVPPLWDEVAALCENLRALSAEVSQSLQRGVGAGELVPLLREELELARNLQEGLTRCSRQPNPQSGARSLEMSRRLRDLLEKELANQSLLKRRGIRLRGPRLPLSRPKCP